MPSELFFELWGINGVPRTLWYKIMGNIDSVYLELKYRNMLQITKEKNLSNLIKFVWWQVESH